MMGHMHPTERPREQRYGQQVRDRFADVELGPEHLICPLFVRCGEAVDRPVPSMPGVSQVSPDIAAARIDELEKRGLVRFVLFGVIESARKDATGSAALDPANPVHTTLRRVREACTPVTMIADLCLCEYTDHGHCGVLHEDPEVTVDNDATLELLGRQAVVLADSGAQIVAPSGMMDGQVGAVRAALDAAGHRRTQIMSYTAKYASGLYGPFRDAGEGAPKFGDRRSYQMDYRRSDEWRTQLQLDLDQGADYVMVKPALSYLDVIRRMRDAAPARMPVVAYHVSGEYSMLHAAAERGWVDLRAAAIEQTTAIRRAGADLVITYFAPQLIQWLG
jgi:porphobilinogen synthase